MTIHEIVEAYFQPKVIELVEKNIQFNSSSESKDSISIITRYADNTIRSYVNGDEELEYGFAIIIVKEYSTDTDALNLEAMNFAQAFMDWLDEQNKNKIFPDFGEKYNVTKIENLQNMPNLSGINTEEALARYMVQGRIVYRKFAD